MIPEIKYIVSGHCGLIGRRLKERVDYSGGRCVLGIDRRDKFRPLELSDLGEIYLDGKFPQRFYHLAAHCKINQSITHPEITHEDNVTGVFQALEFCRKNEIPEFVFMSSSRILSPEENPYTASKKYGENLVRAYGQSYGLKWLIFRPSTVYGPGEDATKRLVHIFFDKASKGEDLVVMGDKDKTLDFTYVDDFIDAVFLGVDSARVDESLWNREYNVSGEEEARVVDVAEKIIGLTRSKSKIVFAPAEPAQPQKVRIDTSEIRRLGYSPKVKLDEGLRRVAESLGVLGKR